LVILVVLSVVPSASSGGRGEVGEVRILGDRLLGEVAHTIWFQGFVADPSSGEPIDATHDVVAEIFDAVTGGTSLWGPETHPATSVVDGWFNIELGHYVAMMYFDSPPYYLELTVDGEVLSPRLKLGSVPSALDAQRAVQEDGDWGISGDNVYKMTGNVGIGLSGPSVPLDVRATEYVAIRGASIGDAGTFYGVMGEGTGDGTVYGVIGNGVGTGSVYGVAGFADGVGVHGRHNGTGVRGSLGTEFYGVHGDAMGQSDAWAGYFHGKAYVSDTLGVGTETPTARLDVNGTVKMLGFHMSDCAVAGRVLTCDGSGAGTWQDAPAGGSDSDWTIAGIDMYSNVTGKVGVGTTSPTSPFTVYSDGSNALESTSANPGGAAVAIRGNATGNEAYGLYGDADADVGVAYGVRAESDIAQGTAYGCYTEAYSDSGNAVGVFSEASANPAHGGAATGVYGRATVPVGASTGVKGEGGNWGVWGSNSVSTARGRLGGQSTGVYGNDGSGQADWAGYFEGNVFFDDAIAVGTDAPRKPIHVYTNYGGAVTYGIEVENYSEADGSATGILFKVGSSNEDRGKGGIAYERMSTWNRGSFHILQDSGANPNVANLADAVLTVENSGDVGIGTRTPASKLEVAGIVHSTSGGFKFPDGSIQTTASLAPPAPARAAGNVVLDSDGAARVELPPSVSTYDDELRYQLTTIGGFAPVYVAEKATGGAFTIAGGEPGMEVSWQVTVE
ncbi:MAG TPA: hypothetical protein VE960_03775, partial [bacterium]|nr:hypothetical protein [bacterium]